MKKYWPLLSISLVFALVSAFLLYALDNANDIIGIKNQTIALQQVRITQLESEIDKLKGPDRKAIIALLPDLEYALRSHSAYVWNPGWCNEKMGTLELHTKYVEVYTKLIDWIEAMEIK